MHHSDTSLVPDSIQTKADFWRHVHGQLASLLDGQRDWVTNLANASSLVYNALLAFPAFGNGSSAVNWCGFYLDSSVFPAPKLSSPRAAALPEGQHRLLLGPFCGKPACQFINTTPGKARGVCADAFLARRTVRVSDVNAYPGHIACDGETNSEIVVPLVLQVGGSAVPLGVLDLDCLAVGGFDEEDQVGLDRIADLVVGACDW
ncbi:GAF domain-like protein [Auriscalpium vulgare]|uniref:GAF domain-like protein n=1 Tax=Auriscalpium vulgare TaxID=40419 RepID=A0ACB8S107_9AGAM|nr:GAF domain-like protein [Auriscalpium vulgare]